MTPSLRARENNVKLGLNVSTGAKEKGITAGIAVGAVIGLQAPFAGPISGASINPARSLAPVCGGKIGGVIRSADPNAIEVEITRARTKGENLWADKGINLPDSKLRLPALTDEDLAHLSFVASHADLVGYSFVRSESDIEQLQAHLSRVGGEHLGIILKIETRQAFERLPVAPRRPAA